MKYIAYGSNMETDRMAVRCPDARLIGTGYLSGARLAFCLHATVEKTGNEEDRVPVAVWEISGADERNLDLYEGWPDYYVREEWPVRMADGTETSGMIYLMRLPRPAPPHGPYLRGIEDAYRRLGFEEQIRTVLQPALERSRQQEREHGDKGR